MNYEHVFNNKQSFFFHIEELRNKKEFVVKSCNINFDCKFNVADFGDLTPFAFEDCFFKFLEISNNDYIVFRDTKFDELHISGSIRAHRLLFHSTKLLGDSASIGILKIRDAVEADFENLKIDILIIIESATNFEMHKCDIDTIGIENPSQRDKNFEFIIEDAYFISTSIKNPVNLAKITYKQTTDFINCRFTKADRETEHVYRSIKKQYADLRNDLTGDFFGHLEKKSGYIRMKVTDEPLNKIFGFLYLIINDFGLKPYQPLAYLAGFSILVALLSCSFESGILTFIGPFKYLGGKDQGQNVFAFSAFFMNLVVTVLWFFTIVGIRKRFKIDK